MTEFLADHNIEGQAELLWGTVASEGWVEIFSLKLLTFADVGLSYESNDRELWRFAQSNKIILLTDNRNMEGENSLEEIIREENTESSLPVLTIGDVSRIDEKEYRIKCATRIAEIVLDIENYLGTGRIYIP
jgi:hypothetical protein